MSKRAADFTWASHTQNDTKKPQKLVIMNIIKNNQFKWILCFTLAITLFNCSKDEGAPPDEIIKGELTDGGVTANDFEAYPGDIGVVLDARPIARKGYKPTQVTININANNGNYTQTIPIDEFSFMSQLKIPLEGLSEAAKNELIDGVPITPEYKDANGNIVFTGAEATVSFQANPNARTVNASSLEETEENQTVTLSEATSYYIQRMNADGSPDNSAWRHLTSTVYANVITSNITNFDGTETDRIFQFIAIPNEFNTFLIKLKDSGRFLRVSNINQFNGTVHEAPNLSPSTDFDYVVNIPRYRFKIEKVNNGSYRIIAYNDLPIKQVEGYGLTTASSIAGEAAVEPTWRMVSTSVEWNVSNIGTSFLEPILPKPQTAFSFNSTLTNCSSGNLNQDVGVSVVESYARTVGWEESLSVNTSNSFSVGAEVSVGFEASFFGNSASYDMSLSTNYTQEWSSTSTSSNWQDYTSDESTTLAITRNIDVPPGTAALVYDVYQFYPNTKVNFVQRLRVEGTDRDTNLPLTGQEIKSQFYFNQFNGVITTIEANSIVITLKGTVTLERLIKVEHRADDAPANCN